MGSLVRSGFGIYCLQTEFVVHNLHSSKNHAPKTTAHRHVFAKFVAEFLSVDEDDCLAVK